MIREELGRVFSWEGHHRRLVARLVLALVLTLAVDAVGAILTYVCERHADGDIHSFGDAVFFSTVQLLTVSSQIKNPLTPWGRVIDVFLEVWALVVVTGVAGAFAAFFMAADPD
jgi:drug/metabolite transporter (DMT)-like permease